MEFWIEEAGKGKVELHAGVLTLTHHCNGKPLVSGAAEEEVMVLLEDVVAIMFPRGAADEFAHETSKAWNAKAEERKRKRPNSGKLLLPLA